MAARREVFVRVFRVDGLDGLDGRAAQDGAWFVEAALDGELRRSSAAAEQGGALVWNADEAGTVAWAVDAEALARLQAHEPRLRVDLVGPEGRGGFWSFDLRDVAFSEGSTATLRKRLQASPWPAAEMEVQVATRAVAKARRAGAAIGGDEAVAAAPSASGPLGVAIGEDHVLIGSSGDFDMTLYITMQSAGGLRAFESADAPLAPPPSDASAAKRFWLKYTIFGVEVETDAFASLKHPRFSPIRDSFKLRTTRSDVRAFLESSPVRVYLCQSPMGEARGGAARQRHQVVASALVRFDALFSGASNFVQATSSCAFALEPHAPWSVSESEVRAAGLAPAIGVGLELHVDGKVDKVVCDEATSPPRAAAVQTEPPVSVAGEGVAAAQLAAPSAAPRVRVQAVSFDLDPADDDGQDAGISVALCILMRDGDAQAMTPTCFVLDEYGQLDQTQVQGLFLSIEGDALEHARVVCVAAGGREIASAALGAAPLLGEERVLELAEPDGAVRGSVRVSLTPEAPPSARDVPSPARTASEASPRPAGEAAKFRVTIDLRSIKGLENAHNVYLQYSSPILGTAQVVQTRPPILIDRFSERIVPHGLRVFQFEMSREELAHRAEAEPLVVEMWHKDRYTSDTRLGFCVLPLRKLLDARPYFQWAGQTFATLRAVELHRARVLAEHDAGTGPPASGGPGLATAQRKAMRLRRQLDVPVVQVQALESDLFVCAFGGDGAASVKRLAVVRCALTVEDLGPGSAPRSPGRRAPAVARRAENPVRLEVDTAAAGASEAPRGDGARASPAPAQRVAQDRGDDVSGDGAEAHAAAEESRAAASQENEQALRALQQAWVEFESWKAEQTREWEAEMQTREALRMSELEQEWARREHDRTMAVRLAQEEFGKLEVRMHRAIADAEKRERAVARLEEDLQRAADQRLADLELLSRRTREESEHQVNLLKAKCAATEGELKRARGLLAQCEKRAAKADEDFAAFRERVRQSPEAELQREIARLQGKIAQLHDQLEQEKERTAGEVLAKEAVKARMVELARELERVRRVEDGRAGRQLDNLRLEYLAREERYVLDGDRQRLQDLRLELNDLRAATLRGPAAAGARDRPMQVALFDELPGEHGVGESRPEEEEPAGGSGVAPDAARRAAELARLAREKEDLLRTGLYEDGHPLLEQLDRHMRLLRERAF